MTAASHRTRDNISENIRRVTTPMPRQSCCVGTHTLYTIFSKRTSQELERTTQLLLPSPFWLWPSSPLRRGAFITLAQSSVQNTEQLFFSERFLIAEPAFHCFIEPSLTSLCRSVGVEIFRGKGRQRQEGEGTRVHAFKTGVITGGMITEGEAWAEPFIDAWRSGLGVPGGTEMVGGEQPCAQGTTLCQTSAS